MVQWVKDLVLPQLWLTFHLWPGNFHRLWVCPTSWQKNQDSCKKMAIKGDYGGGGDSQRL